MPEANVRITCSTEDLDAKLSKSMKLLGAHHDEFGRLVNAEGKFISGLSQARIKMGDWIDELGRARDAQGGFLDGLSATELKLRYYKDELGNVYTAEGELVRVSEELARAQREQLAAAEAEAARQAAEAAKAQEELATAGERGMKSLLSGAKGAAKMANNLSLMIGVLGGGNEGLNKFGQSVVIATQTFSQFALAMKTLPKFVQGFKLLTVATQGQTAAQVILNAVSGNWVALIAGGLAAGTLAYKALSSSTKEAKDQTKGLVSSTVDETLEAQKLIDTLKNLKISLSDVSATQAGFIAASRVDGEVSEIERLTEQYKKLDDEIKEATKARLALNSQGIYNDETRALADKENAAISKRESVKAQQAAEINKLISKDLPVQTELEKLRERAAYYTNVIDQGVLEGEELVTAQSALAENQRKQAEIIDKQNQEAERAAKEAADKERAEAEKKLAEAQRKLGDRFDEYAQGSPLWTAQEKAANDLEQTIAAWRENFAAAGKSEAELNAAIDTLKEEYRRKRLQEFMDANNLKVRETQKLTAEEEYTNTLDRIREAQEKYGLEAAEAERLRAQAETDYADALKKKAEDEEKQRESRLNELGITGLREQMKSPFEKFLEQQSKVATAAEEGLISAAEAQRMNAQLAENFYKENAGEAGAPDTLQEKAEEYRRASSMTFGSNDLYQALTNRESGQERYQTGVTNNLNRMARSSEDNYDALQGIQQKIGEVMKAVGVV